MTTAVDRDLHVGISTNSYDAFRQQRGIVAITSDRPSFGANISEISAERLVYNFWHERAAKKQAPYKAKRFWCGALSKLYRELIGESKSHETEPGDFSKDVDENNFGETAFQRALEAHEGVSWITLPDERRATVKWVDVELPVSFSANSRRRNVDLIGNSSELGTFICELKYKSLRSKSPCNPTDPDYAIFEAMAYLAFVQRNADELEKRSVRRNRAAPTFSWKAVAASKRVLVLANDRFWEKVRTNEKHRTRLKKLCSDAKIECDVEVMLSSVEDCTFASTQSSTPGKVFKSFGHNRELVFQSVFT